MTDVDLRPLFDPTAKVLDVPSAAPEDAVRFFLGKLAYECDPADVHEDMENGVDGFVVLDVRSREAYARRHVPGATSLPHQEMTPERLDELGLDPDTLYVTYCWGPHCNAGTKGAAKLAAAGFRVKEMIGGIAGWEAEGFALDGDAPA
jgi:rhodanese-related sulfurtransferase